jgi:hypothetical protein
MSGSDFFSNTSQWDLVRSVPGSGFWGLVHLVFGVPVMTMLRKHLMFR